MAKDILKALKERILVLDGAMGTMLQSRGLDSSQCPEEFNISPEIEVVRQIHDDYAKSGADIIETNTFGANRLKLGFFRIEDKIKKINQRAIQAARSTKRIVAGVIGPTGKLIEPLGKLSFDKAYEIFAEQAQCLRKAV